MIDTSQYGNTMCFNDYSLNVSESVERKPTMHFFHAVCITMIHSCIERKKIEEYGK